MVKNDPTSPVHVVLTQPSLPAYRVPVYRELSCRSGLRTRLVYGDADGIPNVLPQGFDAEHVPIRRVHLLHHPVLWHSAQWRNAGESSNDVLLLSWDLHYASLIPALLRARLKGIGTVLWGHGYSKRDSYWRRWLRLKSARFSDAVLFYNKRTAQNYIQAGLNPSRVYVALNSLDQYPIEASQKLWLSNPKMLSAFRHEHALEHGPNILFVSRLDPANRLDLLVRATLKLTNTFPKLKIIIIGKGGQERDKLQALAKQLGVNKHVIFLGAIYDEENLAPWFLSSDVFCYPANIGLSLLHAFGYGLPVITSDDIDAQNPEIEALQDGVNGLLYSAGDADDLALMLHRILNDKRLRSNMSEAARSAVANDFTLANMVNGMESAIHHAVKR